MSLSSVGRAVVVGVLSPVLLFAQETTRVSVDSSGAEGNDYSAPAGISADGRFVLIVSVASDLVASDTNGTYDVFVHDRSSGMTERVSEDSSGGEGNGYSLGPAISADGNVVAFTSAATNLVANDGNGKLDIFVKDRSTGVTERVSVDSAGTQSDGQSEGPALSSDGRFVAFLSYATNLVAGDTNQKGDIFVHDRATGTTERVSVDSTGAQGDDHSSTPALSADGQIVAFNSLATNLVAGATNYHNDVFVHDRSTGVTEQVSVRSSGLQGNERSASGAQALSADGQLVAFTSSATNLVANDSNGVYDAFVHDRATGATWRVSVDASGGQGNGASALLAPAISADGSHVAFESEATNLVANDANGDSDVFVRDQSTGSIARASVDSAGVEGSDLSHQPWLSGDGRLVAFMSFAKSLVVHDRNKTGDAFVHELCSRQASWSNYGAGFPGTFGIPSFTSQQNPAFGSTITLDLANSYAHPTLGVLFVGFQQQTLPTSWGGDLLVVPALSLVVSFSFGGNSYSGAVPGDYALCGTAIDLQALELDPGAAKGVSFTPGLELVLGR